MVVKDIEMYYNTSLTANGKDRTWQDACIDAGGPSDDTVCSEEGEGATTTSVVPLGSGISTGTNTLSRSTQLVSEAQHTRGAEGRGVAGKALPTDPRWVVLTVILVAQTSLPLFPCLGS